MPTSFRLLNCWLTATFIIHCLCLATKSRSFGAALSLADSQVPPGPDPKPSAFTRKKSHWYWVDQQHGSAQDGSAALAALGAHKKCSSSKQKQQELISNGLTDHKPVLLSLQCFCRKWWNGPCVSSWSSGAHEQAGIAAAGQRDPNSQGTCRIKSWKAAEIT